MHVLRKLVEAGAPGGIVLDLQVIRPDPAAEQDGRRLGEFDGSWLFARADAARDAIDGLVAAGGLSEERVRDHDVLKHYRDGADMLADWIEGERKPRGDLAARLAAVDGPCVVRERCRLRRLRIG